LIFSSLTSNIVKFGGKFNYGRNEKAAISRLQKKRRKGCRENQGAGFISEIIPVSTV
jgi:hypothetical protein